MDIPEGIPFNSKWIDDNTLVGIDGTDFGYPECLVQVRNCSMVKMSKTPKKKAMKIYPLVKKALLGLDIDKLYAEQGKAWPDFCENIAICAALEFVLFNKPIPICIPPVVSQM